MRRFIAELVRRIGMRAYGDCIVERFGAGIALGVVDAYFAPNDHRHAGPAAHVRFYPDEIPPFPHEPTSDRFAIRHLEGAVGDGVVALVPFTAGAIVFAFTGQVVVERTLYSLQMNGGQHLHDPHFMGKVLHNCDPNCTVDMERGIFVARRDVRAGERVTMDYHETEDVLFRSFDCRCGAANCRGRIAGRLAAAMR